MPIRPAHRAVLFLLLAPALVGAQASAMPLPQQLGPATSQPSEAFTRVSGVVELSGERLLVADDRENRLVVLSLSGGDVRPVGRVGAGPAEYRAIGPLLIRPGGGAYLSDFALRRLLPINDDGTLDTPIRFPVSLMLRYTDATGRIYGDAFLPREAGVRADSMWIVRWNPSGATTDTLMKYNAGVSLSVGPIGAPRRVNPPIDTWQVLPDGDIMLLEASAYRAVIVHDGRTVRTASIPWQPLRVTPAEREAQARAFANEPVRALGQAGSSPSGARTPTYEFPTTYPPFGGGGLGGSYTTRSPQGHVWVERLRLMSDSTPRYDVLDGSTGTLLGIVTLAPRSRLVGVGRSSVYTVQRDADDIERVRRHSYPALAGR